MISIRSLAISARQIPTFCLTNCEQKRGLRIHQTTPPPNVNLPDKKLLPMLQKIPSEFTSHWHGGGKIPKGTREMYRQMGEEKIHTDLLMGQFGIVAVSGGEIKQATFDALRNYTMRKIKKSKQAFAFYRVDPPYKPVTSHGKGKKLGGGKGSIKHYSTPVKAGRVILEVGGNVYWEEVYPWLFNVCKMFQFEAIPVTKDLLARLNEEQARLEEANENPYTFEWMVRNNIFDCQSHLSPYDNKWFGKFVYKDRSNNKKWNLVRQSYYRGHEGKRGR